MITKFALNNNVLTISIIVVLIFMGISVFNTMPRDDMPQFLIRHVSIVTSFPGASPERVENLVSDKIEKVVQEIPEIDHITSESRTGVSIVSIAIRESEFDLQPIFDRIRRKVEGIQDQLPDGTSVTIKDELGDVFGIIIGLTADGFSYVEMKSIADDIRDDLIKLPDAAKVEILGDQEENIFIEFDDARLADLGLTRKKLQGIVSSTNIVFPGGDIKIDGRRIILEPSGSYESIDDLKNTIISSSGVEIIRLGDVTNIYRGYITPQKSITRINGKRGLTIAINLMQGGNIINLGQQIDARINEYNGIYPHGIEIERVASQDVVVRQSIDNFMNNLIQAVIVVLLVMLIFLGVRTGSVVASLIPVTMVMTLLIMSILDVGLNKVTLASLIIALGMLVDNAIVMSESIMVKMEKGTKAFDAAIESSKELSIPLLTSSLTTAAAFMAFFLAEVVLGEIMGNIFVVVSIALLCSWFLSLTMITLLCTYFIRIEKPKNTKPGMFERFNNYYRQILEFSLKKSYLLIGSILVVFVISIFLMRFIPVIFMPKSDRPLVTANIELPLGTTIEQTESIINDIDIFIRDSLSINKQRKEGVENWSSYIGKGAPKYDLGYSPPESSPNAAHILINTTSDEINDIVINKLDEYVFDKFPDVARKISRLASGGGSANPIEIRISGKEQNKLYGIINQVKSQLSSIPGSKNISDDWGMRTKKIIVNIDPFKAQIAGISNQDIAISLQTILKGMNIGDFREGEKVIPIVLRNVNANSLTIEDLEGMNIYAQQSGKSVPLTQVADIEIAWQSSKIKRRDLFKTITVTSDISDGYTASEVINQLVPWLNDAQTKWGYGYKYALGGDAEGSSQSMGAVIEKLPLSIMIIIILLIAQFNSIRKPLIILLTIPLGIIGVILGLLITGSYFGFMAFLGIISLAGIVINNAIVLLDRIKIEIDETGLSPQKAIIVAAQQRFRPIMLTTATTTVGLVPLWIGGGIMWEPMAIGIIFGLLFATVLTLLFVPVMYKVLFRVSYKKYNK